MKWFYGCLLLFCLPIALGCHSAEDEDRRRKKRQAVNPLTEEVDQTDFLRNFFVDCLRSRAGDIWTWESVIDVTILDTRWYLNSADSNCNAGTNADSASCWKDRLAQLLRATSRLQGPSRDCIDEYTFNVTGILPNSRGRKKRQVNQPQTDSEQCTDFYPNSPAVRMFTSCNDQNVILPPRRRDVDFPSVSQFVAEDLICSSELGECDGNEQETISSGDPSVPQWPYLFEAVTRQDSPVRESVSICNNRVFPLETDKDENCGMWQNWSTCFCGRGGSRTRRRFCPAGFTGNLQERERCTEDNCRRGVNYLGVYFFRLFARLPVNFPVRYP